MSFYVELITSGGGACHGIGGSSCLTVNFIFTFIFCSASRSFLVFSCLPFLHVQPCPPALMPVTCNLPVGTLGSLKAVWQFPLEEQELALETPPQHEPSHGPSRCRTSIVTSTGIDARHSAALSPRPDSGPGVVIRSNQLSCFPHP